MQQTCAEMKSDEAVVVVVVICCLLSESDYDLSIYDGLLYVAQTLMDAAAG